MNHGKHSMDKRTQKKIRKAQRDEHNHPPILIKTNALPEFVIAQNMNKPPKEMASPKQAHAPKKLRGEKLPHSSKRTTPGELTTRDAAPQHPNVEGDRWQKTLVKQSQIKNKILTKQMAKKKVP